MGERRGEGRSLEKYTRWKDTRGIGEEGGLSLTHQSITYQSIESPINQ
jgi:hypothetical protein